MTYRSSPFFRAVGRSDPPDQLDLFAPPPASAVAAGAGLPNTEKRLAALAVALGARDVAGWSAEEERLAAELPSPKLRQVRAARKLIRSGRDPLGTVFCRLRSAERRRAQGATFTPRPIVEAMLACAAAQCANAVPWRVVDPGAGSGRYLMVAGRQFPQARLLGVELDPLPALLARANLAALGFAGRSSVTLNDYRAVALPPAQGRTLFIGNPPYVRHHQVGPDWKRWLTTRAAGLGLAASQLSGLHVHFFLATALKAAPGDVGAFITAAEWLDVNYGQLVRDLFLGPLGGRRIVVVEPQARPFPDAASTAAITYFEVGAAPKSLQFQRAATAEELRGEREVRSVSRARLAAETRWSHLIRPPRHVPANHVELGELCRVHRGTVTGANKVWIAGGHSAGLPESVLFSTVTRARELFGAGRTLRDPADLRRVIDLPVDLDELEGLNPAERRAVERFLKYARAQQADRGYVARNRRAWWSVGLRQSAPILATYMARRPPAFVRNVVGARHINIAHGLYPREPLSEPIMRRLVLHLCTSVSTHDGRTYSGGLTKFEPREMERLPVPDLTLLAQAAEDEVPQ